MSALSELIKERRSVRTFDGRNVSADDREKLLDFISGIDNPFGIPVELILLDADEYGLLSPVITGEKLYVAGKVKRNPYSDVAFGYSFERLGGQETGSCGRRSGYCDTGGYGVHCDGQDLIKIYKQKEIYNENKKKSFIEDCGRGFIFDSSLSFRRMRIRRKDRGAARRYSADG